MSNNPKQTSVSETNPIFYGEPTIPLNPGEPIYFKSNGELLVGNADVVVDENGNQVPNKWFLNNGDNSYSLEKLGNDMVIKIIGADGMVDESSAQLVTDYNFDDPTQCRGILCGKVSVLGVSGYNSVASVPNLGPYNDTGIAQYLALPNNFTIDGNYSHLVSVGYYTSGGDYVAGSCLGFVVKSPYGDAMAELNMDNPYNSTNISFPYGREGLKCKSSMKYHNDDINGQSLITLWEDPILKEVSAILYQYGFDSFSNSPLLISSKLLTLSGSEANVIQPVVGENADSLYYYSGASDDNNSELSDDKDIELSDDKDIGLSDDDSGNKNLPKNSLYFSMRNATGELVLVDLDLKSPEYNPQYSVVPLPKGFVNQSYTPKIDNNVYVGANLLTFQKDGLLALYPTITNVNKTLGIDDNTTLRSPTLSPVKTPSFMPTSSPSISPSQVLNPTSSPSSISHDGQSQGNNGALIGGVAAGGVVLIAASAYFLTSTQIGRLISRRVYEAANVISKAVLSNCCSSTEFKQLLNESDIEMGTPNQNKGQISL